MREINKINELELQLGASGASWHDEYKGVSVCIPSVVDSFDSILVDSAYVFVGGLHMELTEGDVIVIFSQ